mgnify:CR=1 FL=1
MCAMIFPSPRGILHGEHTSRTLFSMHPRWVVACKVSGRFAMEIPHNINPDRRRNRFELPPSQVDSRNRTVVDGAGLGDAGLDLVVAVDCLCSNR